MRERNASRSNKTDSVSVLGCLRESVNYAIECMTCQSAGVKRIYKGETSRSAFQQGHEHEGEIEKGIVNHPLVQHFWHKHDGRCQLILMRILSGHQIPLERQTQEAVAIVAQSKVDPNSDLNVK